MNCFAASYGELSPIKIEPNNGRRMYPKRATLAYFVAALGEMKRMHPILSEPVG
jgi:hypothetical protein